MEVETVIGEDLVATLKRPRGLLRTPAGDIFFTEEFGDRIGCIKLSPTTKVELFAGDGQAGLVDGNNKESRFWQPSSLCADSNGDIYVADTYNACVRVISKGTVKIFAGTGDQAVAEETGPKLKTTFFDPISVSVNPGSTELWIAELLAHRLRYVSLEKSSANVKIVGNGKPITKDGTTSNSSFYYPFWIGHSPTPPHDVFVGEHGRVRKIELAKLESSSKPSVSTYAGMANPGYKDGAKLFSAFGKIVYGLFAPNGDLYVSDWTNHRIRKISASIDMVSTVAGSGSPGGSGGGFKDGPALESMFCRPSGMCWLPNGDILVCDSKNNRIRRIKGVSQRIPATHAEPVSAASTPSVSVISNNTNLTSSPHSSFGIGGLHPSASNPNLRRQELLSTARATVSFTPTDLANSFAQQYSMDDQAAASNRTSPTPASALPAHLAAKKAAPRPMSLGMPSSPVTNFNSNPNSISNMSPTPTASPPPGPAKSIVQNQLAQSVFNSNSSQLNSSNNLLPTLQTPSNSNPPSNRSSMGNTSNATSPFNSNGGNSDSSEQQEISVRPSPISPRPPLPQGGLPGPSKTPLTLRGPPVHSNSAPIMPKAATLRPTGSGPMAGGPASGPSTPPPGASVPLPTANTPSIPPVNRPGTVALQPTPPTMPNQSGFAVAPQASQPQLRKPGPPANQFASPLSEHKIVVEYKPDEINRDYPRIARGSFGDVFTGSVVDVREKVAIKDMAYTDPKAYSDWAKEVEFMTTQVTSVNVVKVLGYCITESTLTIVMEYMPKGSLYDLIHTKKTPLNIIRRLLMSAQIAEGLAQLHQAGIMHRDIKSMNILVGETWECKISDFGCAKLVTQAEKAKMTMATGSPIWRAPEVMGGQYNYPADTYSLGVVLYELLQKTLPVYDMQRNVAVFPPKGPKFSFSELILPCVDYNPTKRPNMKQLSNSVRAFTKHMISEMGKNCNDEEKIELGITFLDTENLGSDDLEALLLTLDFLDANTVDYYAFKAMKMDVSALDIQSTSALSLNSFEEAPPPPPIEEEELPPPPIDDPWGSNQSKSSPYDSRSYGYTRGYDVPLVAPAITPPTPKMSPPSSSSAFGQPSGLKYVPPSFPSQGPAYDHPTFNPTPPQRTLSAMVGSEAAWASQQNQQSTPLAPVSNVKHTMLPAPHNPPGTYSAHNPPPFQLPKLPVGSPNSGSLLSASVPNLAGRPKSIMVNAGNVTPQSSSSVDTTNSSYSREMNMPISGRPKSMMLPAPTPAVNATPPVPAKAKFSISPPANSVHIAPPPDSTLSPSVVKSKFMTPLANSHAPKNPDSPKQPSPAQIPPQQLTMVPFHTSPPPAQHLPAPQFSSGSGNEILEWLHSVDEDLAEYASVFADQGCKTTKHVVKMKISDSDLLTFGITKLLHRRLILESINSGDLEK